MPTNSRLRVPSKYKNYGQYNTNPTSEQLLEHFHLNEQDLILIETCRNAQTKLDMSIQLCTLRFLGTFLTDPINVPAVVVANLEAQLGFETSTSSITGIEKMPVSSIKNASSSILAIGISPRQRANKG